VINSFRRCDTSLFDVLIALINLFDVLIIYGVFGVLFGFRHCDFRSSDLFPNLFLFLLAALSCPWFGKVPKGWIKQISFEAKKKKSHSKQKKKSRSKRNSMQQVFFNSKFMNLKFEHSSIHSTKITFPQNNYWNFFQSKLVDFFFAWL